MCKTKHGQYLPNYVHCGQSNFMNVTNVLNTPVAKWYIQLAMCGSCSSIRDGSVAILDSTSYYELCH